ncbi:hypothetical protein ACP4OV_023165 [Aristida adscensionis]
MNPRQVHGPPKPISRWPPRPQPRFPARLRWLLQPASPHTRREGAAAGARRGRGEAGGAGTPSRGPRGKNPASLAAQPLKPGQAEPQSKGDQAPDFSAQPERTIHLALTSCVDRLISNSEACSCMASGSGDAEKKAKSTPSPPAAGVDVQESLLLNCDTLQGSKVFSTCRPLREQIRIHNEDIMPKTTEGSGGLIESLASNENDDVHKLTATSNENELQLGSSTPKRKLAEENPVATKLYGCKTCGKEFRSPAGLGGHRSHGCKSHVGEKNTKDSDVLLTREGYYCPHCGELRPNFQRFGAHVKQCQNLTADLQSSTANIAERVVFLHSPLEVIWASAS